MAKHGEIQERVYRFIKSYMATTGKAPTLQEISKNLHLNSTPAVLHHLKRLEQKKLITRSNRNRGITVRENLTFARVPVLGIANASLPMDIAEETEIGYLQLDIRLLRSKGNLFAVKINGDSMNRHHIDKSSTFFSHGNYAIIDHHGHYEDGDAVLAVVDGGATIKIYKETSSGIVFMPHSTNSKHHPIYIQDSDQLFVNGKVLLVLENPSLR